jgi:hypothetical protein
MAQDPGRVLENSWFEKRTAAVLLQILQMTSKLLENT